MDTAYSLLKLHGIPWHVDVNEPSSHLEIDTFAASPRRHEVLGSVWTPERIASAIAVVIGLVADNEGRRLASDARKVPGQRRDSLDGLCEKDDLFIADFGKHPLMDEPPLLVASLPQHHDPFLEEPAQFRAVGLPGGHLVLGVLDVIEVGGADLALDLVAYALEQLFRAFVDRSEPAGADW